jgi:hypothetical protein
MMMQAAIEDTDRGTSFNPRLLSQSEHDARQMDARRLRLSNGAKQITPAHTFVKWPYGPSNDLHSLTKAT